MMARARWLDSRAVLFVGAGLFESVRSRDRSRGLKIIASRISRDRSRGIAYEADDIRGAWLPTCELTGDQRMCHGHFKSRTDPVRFDITLKGKICLCAKVATVGGKVRGLLECRSGNAWPARVLQL
jgi:hypothetical protein